jgi:hypothetical protein
MKNKYNKEKRYSILKTILRVITLGLAITSLVISLQNKTAINWLTHEQDNIILKVLFNEPEEIINESK